jgi:hypothetical protein
MALFSFFLSRKSLVFNRFLGLKRGSRAIIGLTDRGTWAISTANLRPWIGQNKRANGNG